MSISKEELEEKRSLVVPGLEFYVPSRHVPSGEYLVRVTSVSTLNKDSCWGEYKKETVWYEIVCQSSKRCFVTKYRPDGTSYQKESWVPIPGKFNTQLENMSLSSFIEYKLNKGKEKA